MTDNVCTMVGMVAVLALGCCATARSQTLEGFAKVPADTFQPGPTSGQFITPPYTRTPPFVDQPYQGISSVSRALNGDFLVMPDNGYGAKNNSADYVLRVYRVDPDFKTKLVIERDNFEGAAATFKKIFLVDLDGVDQGGFLEKREVADLLRIRDPYKLGGFGTSFRFPFQTIESVIPLSNTRLGALNDNNYPFSQGRVVGQPDPNEFIIIKLDRPLIREGKHGFDGK